ncbi:MAG TPA: hypothetical protein VI341_13650 [Actinomycetota bacterium]
MGVLTVRQGDAYLGVRRLIHTVVDSNGDPYDLTGMEAMRFEVFRRSTATAPLVAKDLDDGMELAVQSGATLGVVYVELQPDDTEDLDPDDFMTFEVEGTDTIGPVTLESGRFVLLAEQIVEGS